MAQKTTVQLIDDLDGTSTEDIQPVTFALDGVTYEIDLRPENAAKLRNFLADFVDKGRRTGGRRQFTPSRAVALRSAQTTDHARAVREWAKANGHEVADRGRIPVEVLAAFEAAHQTRSGRP